MVWSQDFRNNFDGGVNGSTFSAAASGGASGDAFTRASAADMGTSATPANTCQWTNAWTFTGGLALRMVQPGATRCEIFLSLPVARSDFAMGWGMHYVAAPLASGPIVRLYPDDWISTTGIDIGLTTSNKTYIRDLLAATQSANSAGVLTPNYAPGYWWSFRYQASLNSATINIYNKAATGAPLATMTYAIATPFAVKALWLGIGQPSSGLTLDWDDVITGTGAEPPRPDISNAPPVVIVTNPASRAVQIGSTVNDLAFSATDSDGTISSLTAAVTARPAGSPLPSVTGSPTGIGTSSATLTGTATFAALGTYEVTGTGVDNGSPGLSASAKYTVDTFPVQGDNTWIRTVEPGTDTQLGTQSNLATAMSDGDALTGLITQPSPINAAKWIQTGGLPTTGISIRVMGYRSGTGTLTRHVELYKEDKTTKIWETSPDLVFGSANETQTLQVSSGALALIPLATDRDHLWWKIVDTIS